MELEKNRQERLSILLASPDQAEQKDIALLEDLSRLYPYFQPVHLLLARISKDSTTAAQTQARAACYTNGPLLHKVLQQQEWPTHPQALQQEQEPEMDEEEVFEEITEVNIQDFNPSEDKKTPQPEDPSARIETIEDDFVLEGMSVDFFAFEEKFASEDQKTGTPVQEEQQPVQSEQKEEEPVAVSNYNDDSLPYTFLWWLAKTRKEHQSIFQPYASPKKQEAQSGNPAELQQQYVEHIFHLQSPFDAEEVINNSPQGKSVDHKETEIIENFLKNDPQISPPKAEQIDNENKAKKSAEDHNDLVSETLAKIYIEQMLYHKAIDTYQKLSLKFPEKSRYFADLIQSLEKKI